MTTVPPSYVGTERYAKLDKIGEGTYGVVYKAQDKVTKAFVAMKKYRLHHEDEGIPCSAIREVSMLQSLLHPNVVGIKEIIHENQKLYIILPLMDSDLSHQMKDKHPGGMTHKLTRLYMKQILEATSYCHDRGIMHRDMKPHNILVKDDQLMLADFGLASTRTGMKGQQLTAEIQTLWYRAPEVLLGGCCSYDVAVDIWSIGCMFAEFLTGRPLFPGDSEIGQLMCIFQSRGKPDENTWPGVTALQYFKSSLPKFTETSLAPMSNRNAHALDLMERMLTLDPSKRITARNALVHPYLTSECTKEDEERDSSEKTPLPLASDGESEFFTQSLQLQL